MGRIRSIHPGLFTDEAFVTVSDKAKLLFIGILTECDDRGIFAWKPVTIKMRLRAWDGEKVDPLLSELAEQNMVRRFEMAGQAYGAVRQFCRWQRPKSPQLIHPCPTEVADFVCFEEATSSASERGTALGRILSERQCGRCHYCESEITFYRKKATSLEVDHRIPVSRGGPDEIGNLVAACKSCNSLKRNMTEEEFRSKFDRGELARLCADRRASLIATGVESGKSQSAKTSVAESDAEILPQREDGGGRVEEGSVASATGGGAPPEPVTDLKSMVFGSGLRWWKANSSKSEDALRRWLGQCCARYGDGNVIMATAALQSRPPPVDPFSAMKAELERMVGNGKRANGKEPAGDQRDRRRSALVAAALALDMDPGIPGAGANGRAASGPDGGGEILDPGRSEDGRRVA